MALPVTLFGIDLATFLMDLTAFAALYVAVSLSLNLEFGYAGIPNFGKALYVFGGAAFAGAFAIRFATWLLGIRGDVIGANYKITSEVTGVLQGDIGLSLLLLVLTVILSAGVGGILGYISSYPAIRLREDYLAMLLLGAAQFFQIFVGNYPPIINGTFGIGLPDPYAWAGNDRTLVATVVFVIFAVLVYFYSEKMVRSPLGRTLRAMRDNEVASDALGKNNVAIRRNILIISSAISAMAGALYAFYTAYVNPLTYGRVLWTFWPWVMVIMGGAANDAGVALGAFLFIFVLKVIDAAKFSLQSFIPFDVNWLEYLVFGGMLILILLLRPTGILKEKFTATLPRSTIRGIMDQAFRETPKSDEGDAAEKP